MPLLAIPNVSEGSSRASVAPFSRAIESQARVLDIHIDPIHNRSVFTVTARDEALVEAMVGLAVACLDIDLENHQGVHPRVGSLDVCPFVPHEVPLRDAIAAAHEAGAAIARTAGLPVFFYGAAARRSDHRELPDLRSGGLYGLSQRIRAGLAPDAGPADIDPHHGVVCVGAREPLIAFNVELGSSIETAREIAGRIRDRAVRALAFALSDKRSQVSMNLIDPSAVGIDDAFARVEVHAAEHAVSVVATEIVGLVPERFLPQPHAKAARLLIEPGRSLESVLGD
jgi:glutamate formiminotransferase